jgi:hypothetical protein
MKTHKEISYKDFTGSITVHDWHKGFEVGYQIENGNRIGYVVDYGIKDKKLTRPTSGRTAADCGYQTTHSYYDPSCPYENCLPTVEVVWVSAFCGHDMYFWGNYDYYLYTERDYGLNWSDPYIEPEPIVREINCEELKNLHGEQSVGAMDFYNSNQGLTREQIIKQRPDRSVTGLGSQEGGPTIRYIEDLANPKNIIDLRHMLVIGYYGRIVGESVEMAQWLAENESAFDSQDYYSNELGYSFYKEYGSAIESNPTAFADYLTSFLYNQSYRNEISNPPGCK